MCCCGIFSTLLVQIPQRAAAFSFEISSLKHKVCQTCKPDRDCWSTSFGISRMSFRRPNCSSSATVDSPATSPWCLLWAHSSHFPFCLTPLLRRSPQPARNKKYKTFKDQDFERTANGVQKRIESYLTLTKVISHGTVAIYISHTLPKTLGRVDLRICEYFICFQQFKWCWKIIRNNQPILSN